MPSPNGINIATPENPFPGINVRISAQGASRELTAIEGDLRVHSRRPKDEVMGILMREMPAPCMLDTLHEVLKLTDPNSPNKLVYLRSDPGIGKSYFAKTIGRLLDSRGAVFADLGKKNLGHLLSRAVTDKEQQNLSLEKQIEKASADGTLSQASLAALHKLGRHFDGKQIDWHGLREDDSLNGKILRDVLESVRMNEGWDKTKGSIGFRVAEGELVQADREGRTFIGDEWEKRMEGTEAPLQVLWQVFNGEIGHHTVPLASGENYTFQQKGRAYPNLVIMAANYQADGAASVPDSESFLSRARVFDLQGFSALDWQHRICQLLTGMPVSTLYYINKDKWDRDPKAFTEYLLKYRRMGLSAAERAAIPAQQLTLLAHWPEVMKASESLAKLYSGWGELVDPESSLHQGRGEPAVLREIEEARVPTKKMTPRKAFEHIAQAMIGPPEQFGKRLSQAVVRDIAMTAQGKPQLYAKLYALANENGLTAENPTFGQSLNKTPVAGLTPNAEEGNAEALQLQLAAHLKRTHPALSSDPEQVLPFDAVARAIKETSGKNGPMRGRQSGMLVVPNEDLNSARRNPLRSISCATDPKATPSVLRQTTPPSKLLPAATLLAAFALPGIGERNMAAVWNDAVNGAPPSAVNIARGNAGSGLATTSLLCASPTGNVYGKLHIVRNTQQGATLIVGNLPIDAGLMQHLEQSGITYVNNTLPGALSRIEQALSRMATGEQDPKLRAAFGMRNAIEAGSDDLSFAGLLADSERSTLVTPTLVRNSVMERARG